MRLGSMWKWSSCLLVALVACAGEDGKQGAAGLTGTDGADGADGTNGQTGQDGAGGLNGVDGVDGLDWPGPLPAAYTAADGIAGGAAYSKWYVTDAGGDGALADYGLGAIGADFVRCKACHAWDGLGNAGSYANRTGVGTGNDTRPDVSTVNLRAAAISESMQELYDLVARPSGRPMGSEDSRHGDFSSVLTDEQTWNLIKFMREEWVNPNDLYDLAVDGPPVHMEWDGAAWAAVSPVLTYSNIGALGDAANGDTLFADTCADGCHGADGTNIDIEGRTLGQFLRAKPNELWFKAKFGESGAMDPGLITELSDLQDLYAALADAVAYP